MMDTPFSEVGEEGEGEGEMATHETQESRPPHYHCNNC